jgi:hypothetical protein
VYRIPDVATLHHHDTVDDEGDDETRWYMMVQGTVYGGTWRYMAVQGSVKLYILVCTGTYLFLLFNLDPAGFAAHLEPLMPGICLVYTTYM